MSRKIILFVIIFCLIFAGVVPINMGATNGNQCSARAGSKGLTVHEPIYINGNDDFVVEQNGVVSGTGIEVDPYIIEGWDINVGSANGIDIRNTDVYFIIRNCVIHDGWNTDWSDSNHGIYFNSVQNGKIDNITSYTNWCGILLYSSSNNNITNCYVYNNYYGIYLGYFSNNNKITNCYVYNNRGGILLCDSSNNTIISNTFTNNGIIILGDSLEHYIHDIDTSNLVNGKPLYYFLNQSVNIDNWEIGQLTLVNCTNSIIKNVNISHTDIGIELAFSTNISITNCAIYNNYDHGIWLYSSSDNNLTNCTVYNNSDAGIFLSSSSNNQITNCTVYNNNERGIYLCKSSNTKIHYCNIYSNTDYGVFNYNSESIYQVNATYNWWGSADGPGGVGPGNGDNVTDNVLYNPWLPDPVEIETSIPSEDGGNHPPTLSNGSVSPLYGYLDTVFQFNVTYTDEDNDTPAYVNVIIDDINHSMEKQNANDSDYKDGCVYEYSLNLSEGFHSYSFEASDGVNATSTWTTYGIKVTEKKKEKAEALQVLYYLILVIVAIAVEIVVSAVLLIMRKRTMILKCPKCNTIFKVKRKKEAFKVECPTCGAEGTIKSAAEKKTSPKKPTRTLRCPRCEQAFTVEEKTKPFSVKCPYCGKEGTIR